MFAAADEAEKTKLSIMLILCVSSVFFAVILGEKTQIMIDDRIWENKRM